MDSLKAVLVDNTLTNTGNYQNYYFTIFCRPFMMFEGCLTSNSKFYCSKWWACFKPPYFPFSIVSKVQFPFEYGNKTVKKVNCGIVCLKLSFNDRICLTNVTFIVSIQVTRLGLLHAWKGPWEETFTFLGAFCT